MRKRKRSDTIIRQYKYSVSTDLRPMPAAVWDVARRMQQAWNALIPAYAGSELFTLNYAYTLSWQAFKDTKDEAAHKAAKKALDAMKRATWIKWDAEARAAIAPFTLDYSQGPNVIERFNGCIKAGRTCNVEDTTALTHVQLPFIFPGSAAIPASSLCNNTRRWRIIVEGYNESMYETNGQASRRERRMLYLELGLSRDVSIPLRLDMHRPLPADGLIKRVLLCGRKLPFRGWQWHVLFQIEQPVSQTESRTQNAVSLRICWTRVDDSIVIAQWKDDAGREGVLALPLSATNCADRRTVARHPEWVDWLTDYRQLNDWKDLEFGLPKGSEERMKMRERRRRVEERWQARRVWLYRNFASWLAREYSLIRVPDLDIKRIAEDDTKVGALAGADHWRQVSAPGELIATVADIAQKHGRVTEKYSQTSMEFQSLRSAGVSLRSLQTDLGVQVFDVQWNSRRVTSSVHAR